MKEDPISKALARAQGENASVRNWALPANEGVDHVPGMPKGQPPARGDLIELDEEELRFRNVLAQAEQEQSLIADRYRLLRTRIRQLMAPNGWSKLGITSPSSQEGKTLTAINLAIAASRESSAQVVLIDADLRRPAVDKYLGLGRNKGLQDYLTGDATLDEVVCRPANLQNLSILPSQLSVSSTLSSNSLGSSRLQSLLKELDQEQALVIIDLPPTLVADDVISMGPLLDALMIVIRDGHTRSDDLEETIALLSDFNILGTVLNDVDEDTRGLYGYYYVNQT